MGLLNALVDIVTAPIKIVGNVVKDVAEKTEEVIDDLTDKNV